MPYAIAHLERILSDMRRLAPALSMVRTDHLPATSTQPERCEVVFDKAPRRDTVILSSSESRRAGAIARLATFFGLTPIQAAEMYALGEQLHTLNPVGSWCLTPSAIPGACRVEDGPTASHPLIGDVLADLREALPSVTAIQVVSALQNLPQGHARRRVLVRFRAAARQELAALDTAHFSAHLNSLLLGVDEHAARNTHRGRIWAGQLGIALLDLPAILHDVSLLAVSLPATEIVLGPPAAPSADARARAAG